MGKAVLWAWKSRRKDGGETLVGGRLWSSKEGRTDGKGAKISGMLLLIASGRGSRHDANHEFGRYALLARPTAVPLCYKHGIPAPTIGADTQKLMHCCCRHPDSDSFLCRYQDQENDIAIDQRRADRRGDRENNVPAIFSHNMSLPLSSDSSAAISICVYRPRPSYTIDDLLLHLHKILKSLEKAGCFKFAVLRGLTNGNWVAVYAIWETRSSPEASISNKFLGMEALQKEISPLANTIDCSRYEFSCAECKETNSIAELSKGDAMHFRWIQADASRQEVLCYSCLAILKAYLKKVEGLRSCTFYKSLDGRKIAGLGIWENAQAAYTFISSPQGSPAVPYWNSLGAKLRYGICEVVYVTVEEGDR